MSASEALTAYCMKCREKRPIQDPVAEYNQRGSPVTRGVCAVCGTKMYRIGRTPAHDGVPKPVKEPEPRRGNLVIVESPAKAKTIGKFLGKEYKVTASVGHVRDLLRSRLSVDVEHDFTPEYRVPNEKRKLVKELTAAVAKAETVYLATDLDREGEAIAWHLMEAAGIEAARARRVVFHEITEPAIQEAFARPAELDMHMVDAQQARRILDRLVGYQISPLLWERVRNRLTAGRVQSVAVRLIVDREREIEAFEPQEYWTLEVELRQQDAETLPFRARLYRIDGENVDLHDEASVTPILDALENGRFQVDKVREGKRQRKPAAPFTTSTLQQAASGRLNFRAQRTMRIAQQLYEGIELAGGEPVGLITYMRTDSVNVAKQAQQAAREFVQANYGADYVPAEPPRYTTRSRSAQEAHEAVRPTAVSRSPKSVKQYLSRDQYRLYELIWQRFVASQMAPARYTTRSADVAAGPNDDELPYLFRASGSSLVFPGFMIVYAPDAKEEAGEIPPLVNGEYLDLVQLLPEQHFTQPPPRFNEASLVKELEENGIGRPSTYAPTISTIQQRGYVESEARSLRPTEIGVIVNDLLAEHFPDVISVGFTAEMEDQLDQVAAGEADWVQVLRDFYGPFSQRLKAAQENMPELNLGDQPVGRDCPQCGNPLVVKWGRYGKFIACQNYPECRHTEPWLDKIGVNCPQCGGDLVRKRTRRGRPFYGCARYPECDFTSWKQPLTAPCPVCGGLLVLQKKGIAQCIQCEEQVPLDSMPETEE